MTAWAVNFPGGFRLEWARAAVRSWRAWGPAGLLYHGDDAGEAMARLVEAGAPTA